MNIWLLFLAMALGTFTLRASFILLFGRIEIPDIVSRALRFVPPAVLTALVFPAVLFGAGGPNLSSGNVRLLAALVAALVSWRTKNVFLTIAVGLGLLWLLQALVPS